MTKSVRIKEETIRKSLYGCGILFIGLLALYMYFVSASVHHVVIRGELNQEAEQLKSEIGVLETAYIREQHKLNEAVVMQHGFKRNAQKIFIDRTTDSLVLSSRAE